MDGYLSVLLLNIFISSIFYTQNVLEWGAFDRCTKAQNQFHKKNEEIQKRDVNIKESCIKYKNYCPLVY